MYKHRDKNCEFKNEKVQACKTSTLITEKNNIKLSLHKCSNKTKIRDTSFDIMIG